MEPAKPAKKKPHPLVAIGAVTLIMPLALTFLLGLLMGVANDPAKEVARLPVFYANFDDSDDGTVGAALTTAVEKARDVTGMPSLIEIEAARTSPRELIARVESGEGYAAFWVREHATSDLENALAALGKDAYNSSDAIHFYWDEGRNPLATPRIGGAIRGLLVKFCSAFALEFVAQIPSALLGPIAKSDHPEVIVLPVNYTEVVMHPNTLPLAANALTVGSIYMIVYAFLIAVASHKIAATYVSAARPLARLGFITATMLWLASALAATYATLVVSIAGEQWLLGSVGWALMYAIQSLFIVALSPIFLAAAEVVGPDKVGILMLPAVIGNLIAGSYLDTAHPGFGFFSFMPLYQSSTLLRFTFFGSLASEVPACIGELFAWAGGGYLLFIAASIHAESKRRRALLADGAGTLAVVARDDELQKPAARESEVMPGV